MTARRVAAAVAVCLVAYLVVLLVASLTGGEVESIGPAADTYTIADGAAGPGAGQLDGGVVVVVVAVGAFGGSCSPGEETASTVAQTFVRPGFAVQHSGGAVPPVRRLPLR